MPLKLQTLSSTLLLLLCRSAFAIPAENRVAASGGVSEIFRCGGDRVAQVAPPPPVTGQVLYSLLERTARALGLRIEYSESTLRALAEKTLLYGTLVGLTPRQVLDVTVLAAGLDYRVVEGVLEIRPLRDPTTPAPPLTGTSRVPESCSAYSQLPLRSSSVAPSRVHVTSDRCHLVRRSRAENAKR